MFSVLYMNRQHYFCLQAMACYEKLIFCFYRYQHLLATVVFFSDMFVSDNIAAAKIYFQRI